MSRVKSVKEIIFGQARTAVQARDETERPGFALIDESCIGDGEGNIPEPTTLDTVDSWFFGRRTPMTICRHNLAGTNRFHQDAAEFPYCVLNMEARRDCSFDLRTARWFQTREEAVACAAGCVRKPAENPPDSRLWSAEFAGGVGVELRAENGGGWVMWVRKNGRLERRKDFASRTWSTRSKRLSTGSARHLRHGLPLVWRDRKGDE